MIFIDAQGLQWAPAPGPLREGLSFRIPAGLSWITGGEGRGKTALLSLLAGTLQPSGGRLLRLAASLCQPDVTDAGHDATVARAWLATWRARLPDWQDDVAHELADAFGLAEHLDKPLFMLSAGSRRKVGLVAAAAGRAELTLLDGPFAALDARACRLLTDLLAEAAACPNRAWVVADYQRPAGLAQEALAAWIDLGD